MYNQNETVVRLFVRVSIYTSSLYINNDFYIYIYIDVSNVSFFKFFIQKELRILNMCRVYMNYTLEVKIKILYISLSTVYLFIFFLSLPYCETIIYLVRLKSSAKNGTCGNKNAVCEKMKMQLIQPFFLVSIGYYN